MSDECSIPDSQRGGRLNQYEFGRSSNVGRQGVKEITRWLMTHPNMVRVKDCDRDMHYQRRGIDLVYFWRGPDNRILSFPSEVKTDTYDKTGNLFLETWSNEEKGKPGCFVSCEATHFFYYFIYSGRLMIFKMRPFQRWFERYGARYREARTTTRSGKKAYTTVGRLVPISDIEKLFPNRKICKFYTIKNV